ncbi:AAA domain-containing protein [Oceanirhabdus seepicola]|uniref:AAA family ATPase n=1 Tax=Oceanirhabdus seepicola TaxID=2828781 RepID=A0A9J6NYW0_9CLOT|nr:AAA family ATPase [Oceanirhabdus seepicola]
MIKAEDIFFSLDKLNEIKFPESKTYNVMLLNNNPVNSIQDVELEISDVVSVLDKNKEELGRIIDVNIVKKLSNIDNSNTIKVLEKDKLKIFKITKLIKEEYINIQWGKFEDKNKDRLIENLNNKHKIPLLKNGKKHYWLLPHDGAVEVSIEKDTIKVLSERKLNMSKLDGKTSRVEIYIIHLQNIIFNKEVGKEIDITEHFKKDINTKFTELWIKYNNIEKKLLKEKSENTKKVKVNDYKIEEGKLKIETNSFQKDENLLSVWEKCIGDSLKVAYKDNNDKVVSYSIGELSKVDHDNIEIDIESDLVLNKMKKNSSILISQMGDEIRINRRDRAMFKLKTSQASMKGLSKILTGEHKYSDNRGKYKLKDTLVGKFLPEENQRKAVEGAINTPEIFLIQGPPGTGKTTIIRKIVSELTKNRGKDKLNKNDILVTAYQNTAVDNVIDKLNDTGGIAYRHFGANIESNSALYKEISNDIIKGVSENLGSEDEEKKVIMKRIIAILSRVDNCISINEINTYLKEALEIYKESFSIRDEVVNEFEKIIDSIEKKASEGIKSNYDTSIIKNYITDIDKETDLIECYDKLYDLQQEIDDYMKEVEEKQTLRICSEIKDMIEDAEELIEEAQEKKFRSYLNELSRIISEAKEIRKSEYDTEEIKNSIKIFRVTLKAYFSENINSSNDNKEKKYEILENWIYELENNPNKLSSVLKKYSDILATTCQKVGSKSFYNLKAIDTYEYVIVDEAARANPLDLLIPLVTGKKVLLVGDHKQLPHLIEQDIESRLKDDEKIDEEVYEKHIKESLFGQLFEDVPEDRKVMLNTQYRMSKEIGDIVSELFYDNKLNTGTDVVNDTPLFTGNSLVSIDVKGQEDKETNENEVEKICKILKEIDIEGHFDIGIITFYKKQASLLQNEIKSLGLVNNIPVVNTVDAFQGKENDIIILSTVRTKGLGFTTNKNRLNVAMSRAKKLLVFVSDMENMKRNEMYSKIFSKSKVVK